MAENSVPESNPSADSDTEDTLELARRDQELQGPWEAEFSYGGEADLHTHHSKCVKNPGHVKFIPVHQFNETHLPEACRDNDLMDMIRCLADMTVRVTSNYTSYRRPELFPRSGKPYPFHKMRNKAKKASVGTGWLWRVNVFPNDYDKSYAICSCKDCKYTPTPKTEFAHIHIYTAAHVVYDWIEAEHASCDFFFDKGVKPLAPDGVVTLIGMSTAWHNLNDDSCEMRFVTHDLYLADRLSKLERRWNSLVQTVGNKYRPLAFKRKRLPPQNDSEADPKQTLTVIVSHPHGCSKQVSVGHYTKRCMLEGGLSWYKYNAATCPGSSGAKMLILERGSMAFWYTNHVHGGGTEKHSNEGNYSGYGFEGDN